MNEINLPRRICIGGGTLAETGALMQAAGLSRALIVTDAYLVQSGLVDRLQTALAKSGCHGAVFSETVPDPTVAVVEAALKIVREGEFDCIIGFGGGSPIDTSKAVAALALAPRSIPSLKVPTVTDTPGLPIIAIPTTAGTGSEATRFTIITDETTDEKMLCAGLAFLPSLAVIDYELTLTKPRRLTADTGIDSLTHAIEAYVSKKANAFSDAMALSAMKLIAPHLRTACDDPSNRPAREAMMLGAHHAGIAFSNASVALVHGMSRPIGAFFHVPHGLSNAMLLPVVTRYSVPAATARYADCARAMGVVGDDCADQLATARLVEELERLNADLDVPGPGAYGISKEHWDELLPVMSEQAIASGSPANNPMSADAAAIAELYRQAWR